MGPASNSFAVPPESTRPSSSHCWRSPNRAKTGSVALDPGVHNQTDGATRPPPGWQFSGIGARINSGTSPAAAAIIASLVAAMQTVVAAAFAEFDE